MYRVREECDKDLHAYEDELLPCESVAEMIDVFFRIVFEKVGRNVIKLRLLGIDRCSVYANYIN